MKKIVLIPLLLTLLNADLPMPNSKHINHTVTITNAEAFNDMAVMYCSADMASPATCTKIKNNYALHKYKFAPSTYLFAIKNSSYEKYAKRGFFTKSKYAKALAKLLRGLNNPIGVSYGKYVSNDKVTSRDVDTHSRYKITKIKDGHMYFELLE